MVIAKSANVSTLQSFPLYGMYKNATHDSTVSAYSVSNNN